MQLFCNNEFEHFYMASLEDFTDDVKHFFNENPYYSCVMLIKI